MPPRGFKTISIPEDVYNEIFEFYNKEAGPLKKKGIKSLSAFIIAAIYEYKDEYNIANNSFSENPIITEDINQLKTSEKILIIDDSEVVCETLSILLKDEGFKVDIAYDGKTGINKNKNNKYSLALIDFNLPDITFLNLINQLVKDSPDMIKIIVTGHGSLNQAIDALNYGASGYITKPIKPNQVINIITNRLVNKKKNLKRTQKQIIYFIDKKLDEIDK